MMVTAYLVIGQPPQRHALLLASDEHEHYWTAHWEVSELWDLGPDIIGATNLYVRSMPTIAPLLPGDLSLSWCDPMHWHHYHGPRHSQSSGSECGPPIWK